MKQIHVIRHSQKEPGQDAITEQGKQLCLDIKDRYTDIDLVYSSPFKRTQETAGLLSDENVFTDDRAGILKNTDEQRKMIGKLRQTHPLGVVGAIWSDPELIAEAKVAGKKLLNLIKDILAKLPDDGKALIISHDGTMIACEKLINNESFDTVDKTYDYLEGFVVDEELKIKLK